MVFILTMILKSGQFESMIYERFRPKREASTSIRNKKESDPNRRIVERMQWRDS